MFANPANPRLNMTFPLVRLKKCHEEITFNLKADKSSKGQRLAQWFICEVCDFTYLKIIHDWAH